MVLVELNDGREVYLEVDSSTTSRELCVDAADEMGCNHNAGYGLQIGLMGKVLRKQNELPRAIQHTRQFLRFVTQC